MKLMLIIAMVMTFILGCMIIQFAGKAPAAFMLIWCTGLVALLGLAYTRA